MTGRELQEAMNYTGQERAAEYAQEENACSHCIRKDEFDCDGHCSFADPLAFGDWLPGDDDF